MMKNWIKGATLIAVLAGGALTQGCKNEAESTQAHSELNPLEYVNPFMGSDGPGNTYPGAQVPFGQVQLSPDHGLSGWDRISGYSWPDTIITGFSHMHLSGTGAGDLYDLLLAPFNSKSPRDLKDNGFRPYSTFSHDEEKASPGYYWVNLKDTGIEAELTATKRVGVHRYTFPQDAKSGFEFDLGYSLNWDGPTDTYIKVEDFNTIVGYRMSSGWAPDQRVYFVLKLDTPIASYQLYNGEEAVEGESVKGKKAKIVINMPEFDKKHKVQVAVAVATSSVDGARKNMTAELPLLDFDKARAQAESVWTAELNKIHVEASDAKVLGNYYTGLYQSMLAPVVNSDVDGYYKAPNGQVEQADGFVRYDRFSLWDTFRTAHPLYTIMHPDEVKDMIKSFLAHYDETGLLPVWSMQGNETNMMIGYHSVPVIVDAYQKGFEGIDWEKALEACVASASIEEHGIGDYQRLGYVPLSDGHENWSVSKTLEYAYDDWCIAQLAKGLGKQDIYETFSKRAENWRNHYDASSSFMRPKHANGKFEEGFVAKDYTDQFCESNAWHYFWFVPQNIEGLIDAVGGAERFEEKLDSMFTYSPAADDELPIFSTGMIGQYAHGNEPSHHVAYLYNYIGKPWKAQERVREIMDTQYRPEPNGHCGNEDCGQMSSWYVMSALGLYPVNPAQGLYVVGSPAVDKASFTMPSGNKFEVVVNNNSKENVYISSVSLNGEALKSAYITHEQMQKGGVLEFTMSNKANEQLWTNAAAYPPSSNN